MSAEIQETSPQQEESKSEPQQEAKLEGSPEMRYMNSIKDDQDISPYEKSVSTAEIKERINQSLQMHRGSQQNAAQEPAKTAKSTNKGSPAKVYTKQENLGESVEEIQPQSLTPTKASLYRINQPLDTKSNKSPNRGVISKEIYNEFDMNNSYYQKMLQDAHNTGIKNLSTTSIRSESPHKYERKQKEILQQEIRKKSPFHSPGKSAYVPHSAENNLPAGPPNASQEILSRVFDGNLSIHSPSKKMQDELERKSTTPGKGSMIEEKMKNTNSILERFVDLSASKGEGSIKYGKVSVLKQDSPIKENKSILEISFESAIESLGKSEGNITPEDQIIKFAGCINSMRKDVKLGGLIGVFVIWRTFPNEISEAVIDHVLQNVFTQLIHYESQDEPFIVAALELVGFFGQNEISCNSVSVIRAILCASEPNSDLQITSINTLVLLGYPGLQILIDLANKDYQQLQQIILSRLCSIPFIQVFSYYQIQKNRNMFWYQLY